MSELDRLREINRKAHELNKVELERLRTTLMAIADTCDWNSNAAGPDSLQWAAVRDVALGAVRSESDPTADYYKRIDQRKAEAWAKYHEAVERGEDFAVLNKLKEAAIDAGYTGD